MSDVTVTAKKPDLAPWLGSQLTHLLGQRGHAALIEGPSGLGQYDLALALASAWLCDNPSPDGACGICNSCHLIGARAHPDLFVLMPEVEMLALEWPLPERIQAELDGKKRKPSKEIRVDAMQDLVAFSQRTDARGRGKAALIFPAERMNTISANGLLKTLEEPGGALRFVLASASGASLLPTIRSRCQSHVMQWPNEQVALQWLAQQGVPAADAGIWLGAAGGRAHDAWLLAASGMPAASWSQLPAQLKRGDASGLDALFPASPPNWISSLQKLVHDLSALSHGQAPRFFAASTLGAAALVPSARVLSAWSKSLNEAAKTAQHPFNAGLMLEALAVQSQRALNARPDKATL